MSDHVRALVLALAPIRSAYAKDTTQPYTTIRDGLFTVSAEP